MSTTLTHPLTAAEITDDWILAVREAMSVREGVPIRANPHQPSIDAYSPNLKQWGPILTPSGSLVFASWDDRNAVLARIQNK